MPFFLSPLQVQGEYTRLRRMGWGRASDNLTEKTVLCPGNRLLSRVPFAPDIQLEFVMLVYDYDILRV